jgi:hypothetical protein
MKKVRQPRFTLVKPVRFSPEEWEKILACAAKVHLPPSTYVRETALGYRRARRAPRSVKPSFERITSVTPASSCSCWRTTSGTSSAASLYRPAATLTAMPATAQKSIEKYKANAIMQTAGAGSMAEINIYRWSSDEEREQILEVNKKATAADRKNDRDVAKELRGMEKAGYAFFAGKQGYPLRYARSFDMGDGKRQIILATDRPVSFQEAYKQSRLGDFDVTVVVLTVDAEGNGEGVLSIGTEVKWNESSGKLEVTNVTSQPTKLTNVRRADK